MNSEIKGQIGLGLLVLGFIISIILVAISKDRGLMLIGDFLNMISLALYAVGYYLYSNNKKKKTSP